jgi:membrane protein DedA with SNARE-associated domain
MFTLITAVIQKIGLIGVGLLMLVENLIPVIPSELIMPMAGFESARGTFSPVLVVVVGTIGSIVGALPWYWAGRWLGVERVTRWAEHGGRWLTLSPDEVERGAAWFQRWGAAAVCIGRCLPGVRGVICLPAGMARMPFWSYLLWSSIGALAWTALLTLAGFALQARYLQVEHWLNPVTDVVVGLAVVAYVVRVIRYKPAAEEAKVGTDSPCVD